jgi:hypothetical protein
MLCGVLPASAQTYNTARVGALGSIHIYAAVGPHVCVTVCVGACMDDMRKSAICEGLPLSPSTQRERSEASIQFFPKSGSHQLFQIDAAPAHHRPQDTSERNPLLLRAPTERDPRGQLLVEQLHGFTVPSWDRRGGHCAATAGRNTPPLQDPPEMKLRYSKYPLPIRTR